MFANLAASAVLGFRRRVALWVTLVMGIFAVAWPAEVKAWTGQPLAYVTSANGISVIDMGDNLIVDTIPCCSVAAVAPDGKYLYAGGATTDRQISISVIDASNDAITGTITLDLSSVPGGAPNFLNAVKFGRSTSLITMTISPDGRQLYVASGICVNQGGVCGASPNSFGTAFWLVDLTTRTVTAANIPPGSGFGAYIPAVGDIAVAPNGLAFYTKSDQDYILGSCTLSIYAAGDISHFTNIDPASSGGGDVGLAISPDSKRVYIGCDDPETIFIIDTSTKTIVNTIPSRAGVFYSGIAVTPDGKHLYAAGSNVAVIDTSSNATVATVATGGTSDGLAVTPDGTRVYVTNPTKNTVSVIDTASNAVVATIPIPNPSRIEIVTPPQGTPFLALRAGLDVNLGHDPSKGKFQFNSSLVLSSTASNGIHPDTEPVKLQAGPFIATIPAGSFKARGNGFGRVYSYEGNIDGVSLKVKIAQTGTLRYSVQVEAQGAHLNGIANPVQVSLSIGDDAGLTSLTAQFEGRRTAGLTK